MSGMLRSIKTRSGRHLIAHSTASRPDLAEIVSKPYRVKTHASHSRYCALSSTTKIKAFLITKSSRVLNCYAYGCRSLLRTLTPITEAAVEQINPQKV